MELRIDPVTIPEVINFNFADLKAEIIEKTSDYANLAYSEDQIKEAKADRAKLNKFSKALNDERIRVKNACLAPYEDFERKVKELDGIVKKAITNIDEQVKGFEQAQKDEKLAQIRQIYDEISRPEWVPFEQLYDARMLNKTVSLAEVKTVFIGRVEAILSDIATLQEMPQFSFEAVESYKRSFSITDAIAEGKRLAEIQRRKAEDQARREEEARIRAQQREKAEQMQATAEEAPAVSPDPARDWVSFKALLSREEALALARFFAEYKIKFMQIGG